MDDNIDIVEELENKIIDIIENASEAERTTVEKRIEIYYATDNIGYAYVISSNFGEFCVNKIASDYIDHRMRWIINDIKCVRPVIKCIFLDALCQETKKIKMEIYIDQCINAITWDGEGDKKEVICEARDIALEALEIIKENPREINDVRFQSNLFL